MTSLSILRVVHVWVDEFQGHGVEGSCHRLALEVKARELSAIGGQEISSRLIYSVAQSREEGVALAIQLAEQREATALAEGNIR